MRYYETVFIARQDVTSNQVESMTQHYTSVIKEHGGEVTKTEFCGLRPLAYPIKKKSTGFYYLFEFKADGSVIAELEIAYKRDERLLRFLTVKLDKHAIAFNEKFKNKKVETAK